MKSKADRHAAKLAALPITFTIPEVAALTPAGLRSRHDLLERLKLSSPPLDPPREARWKTVRDAYAAFETKRRKAGVGEFLLSKVHSVLRELREHYAGKTPYNVKGQTGGDRRAFVQFFKEMESEMVKAKGTPASSVTL